MSKLVKCLSVFAVMFLASCTDSKPKPDVGVVDPSEDTDDVSSEKTNDSGPVEDKVETITTSVSGCSGGDVSEWPDAEFEEGDLQVAVSSAYLPPSTEENAPEIITTRSVTDEVEFVNSETYGFTVDVSDNEIVFSGKPLEVEEVLRSGTYECYNFEFSEPILKDVVIETDSSGVEAEIRPLSDTQISIQMGPGSVLNEGSNLGITWS